jgi:hypothetical protein
VALVSETFGRPSRPSASLVSSHEYQIFHQPLKTCALVWGHICVAACDAGNPAASKLRDTAGFLDATVVFKFRVLELL